MENVPPGAYMLLFVVLTIGLLRLTIKQKGVLFLLRLVATVVGIFLAINILLVAVVWLVFAFAGDGPWCIPF